MNTLELMAILILAMAAFLYGYIVGFNAGKKGERIVWIRWMIAQFKEAQVIWDGSPEEIAEDFLKKAL